MDQYIIINPEVIRNNIANSSLFDDVFMSQAFDNNPRLAEEVLRPIIGRDDLEVTSVKSQYSITAVEYRSVRMDVVARDNKKNVYNIEVQKTSDPNLFLRARYYQAQLDSKMLDRGEGYENLHKSYIIFLLDYDLFGKGFPIYHVRSMISETDTPYENGSATMYVNGTYVDVDDAIGSLMRDMHCVDYREIANEIIRETVRVNKDPGSREGRKMSEVFERAFADDIRRWKADVAEARQKAEEKTRKAEEKTRKAEQEIIALKKLLAEHGIDYSQCETDSSDG